jgi:lysylphosphatidylglycerol synthetase-like protein (DUF2156 family)
VTPVLFLLTVTAITVAFIERARRKGISMSLAASGAASLVSGLVTSGLMTAHLVSVLLPALAQREPFIDRFEVVPLAILGLAIQIPGMLCVSLAGGLIRGELHAQKRTLAAAVVVLGLTAPLAPFQPLALIMAVLALVNIGALLSSRTEVEFPISEPAGSLRY